MEGEQTKGYKMTDKKERMKNLPDADIHVNLRDVHPRLLWIQKMEAKYAFKKQAKIPEIPTAPVQKYRTIRVKGKP